MRVVTGADEILRIENISITIDEVFDAHGIHVMDDDSIKYLMLTICEITSEVSRDHKLADLLPLVRTIEVLIKPALSSEGRICNPCSNTQILEAILERGVLNQL